VYSYSTGVDSRLYLPECHVNVTNRNVRLLRVRNYGYVTYGVTDAVCRDCAYKRNSTGLCTMYRTRLRYTVTDHILAAVQAAGPDGGIAISDGAALAAFLSAITRAGDGVCSRLCLIIDYDLTMSASTTPECHHMLRDAEAMPSAFRHDVHTLFAAAHDEAHPEHLAIFGPPATADRPHRFWTHYNGLLIKHGITAHMIENAVAEEKLSRGALLRRDVGELLSLCDACGVLVLVLSAGIDVVIHAACAQDGVELPAGCRLLTNRLLFDESGHCSAVVPSSPPASREGKLLLLSSLDELAGKDLVLMVGDKPVDARVARGLPPLSPLRSGGCSGQRSILSFGFYNTLGEQSSTVRPDRLDDWRAAYDIVAESGDSCSFAPLVALLQALLRHAAQPPC
jgi:hypothetical protein